MKRLTARFAAPTLLPTSPAVPWDTLMAHPNYIHALDLLP